MRSNLSTGNNAIRGAAFGSALLCVCLSVACSFGLGFALTSENNRALFERQAIVEQLNLLSVPGAALGDELRSVASAAYAALFYAFSLGLGLPVLFLPWLYFFRGPGTRRAVKWLLLLFIMTALGCSLNRHEVAFRESAFVLGTGCWLYIWLFRSGSNTIPELKEILRRLPGFTGAVLLPALIALNSGIHDFKSVRDALLLSNDWGRPANDFYYRYTLMAAEPIKHPARKTQPLCLAPRAQFEEQEWRQLERVLNRNGVILVGGSLEDSEADWDWILKKEHPYLVVSEPGAGREERIEMSRISFLPELLVHEEWNASKAGLCFWIGLSLFVGIPGAMIGGAAWVLTRLVRGLGRLVGRPSSLVGEAVLPIGAVLLIGFHLLFPFPADAETLTRLALCEHGWAQVRAVRLLGEAMGSGFRDPGVLLRLLNDPDIRVRYWAARMVRGNEGKPVMNRLIDNLELSCVHVAGASARGLERFHSSEAVRALRRTYRTRTDWYVRDVVYRALRSNGRTHLSESG
ncbi:MAG: HEAT repeat domain-containing protein [Deltaproteobacteria bacterium]|nr:HEAT repeat domain-containing protein [Deltaproteobacteria bacterium]